MAPGGFSLVPKGFAGAVCFTASALSASIILTFLLITLIILSSLSLDKLLNLITFMEVVALGPVDLAGQPFTFPDFLLCSDFPAGSARGNFLARGLSLGLLAGTRRARTFHSHHFLLVALLALSLTS